MEDKTEPAIAEYRRDFRHELLALKSKNDVQPWQHWAFILSCLGTSVGFGSFWRFPALAHEHGSGTFIICYIIMVVVVAMPIYKLELGLAQFSGRNIISIWKCFPLGKGIGMSFCYAAVIVSVYMSVILAYLISYLFYSMTGKKLEWAECNPSWRNDTGCYSTRDAPRLCTAKRALAEGADKLNLSVPTVLSIMSNVSCINATQSAAEIYFYKRILGLSKSITTLGEFRIELAVAVAVVWILTYVCVTRRDPRFGYIVFITVPIPIAINEIFLGSAFTLTGASLGVDYLTKLDLHTFLDPLVWVRACQQALFSFGLGMGTAAYLGSRNSFFDRSYSADRFVAANTVIASITSTLIAFCTLGHFAGTKGTSVPDMRRPSQAVPFITSSAMLTTLGFPKIAAAVFFGTLALFMFIAQLCLVASLLHSFRELTAISHDRFPFFAMAYCMLAFVFTLPLTMQNGFYVINLLDTYVGGNMLPIITTYEVVALCWVYGSHNVCRDFEFLTGRRPGGLMVFCWKFVSPIVLLAVSSYSAFAKTSSLRMALYEYPLWASVIGWLMVGVGIAIIGATYWTVYTENGKLVRNTVSPREDWGPKDTHLLSVYKKYVVTVRHSLIVRGGPARATMEKTTAGGKHSEVTGSGDGSLAK
ncbi:sodium- and chloride-dependent glycine transporter 2-like [Ornithodoros turicata]|uniref:sodium- and chloride-dependent glycine transporter 2-like n=1 Tax=Ornithodoros turicata TaxID=34597 RepID=UPI0031399AB3